MHVRPSWTTLGLSLGALLAGGAGAWLLLGEPWNRLWPYALLALVLAGGVLLSRVRWRCTACASTFVDFL